MYKVLWAKTYYVTGVVELAAESKQQAEEIALDKIGDYQGSMQYAPQGDWIEGSLMISYCQDCGMEDPRENHYEYCSPEDVLVKGEKDGT